MRHNAHRFLALVTLAIVLASQAGAQEFGRNKVRYEDFDFSVLESSHFRVLHYEGLSDAAARSARILERWNARFRRLFDHTLSARSPVVLYADHPDFQQTNIVPGLIPQGVGGVTEGRRGRIVVPLAASNRENSHVLGHELVHAFHFDMTGSSRAGLGFTPDVPLWFVEGIAEYATLGKRDSQTAMWLRDAVAKDDLPSIAALSSDPDYNPYRFGHAIWAYIGNEYGDRAVRELYRTTLQRGFSRAARRVLGVDASDLSTQWHDALRAFLAPQLQARRAPTRVGRAFPGQRTGPTISPSLSPDARYVAFFSQPDVFSFDLTVAERETGETVGRLSAIGANRHFDELRFTASAGSFSPDGSQIAFVVQERGDNGVAFASVPDLTVERTMSWNQIDAISHVGWHPDGDHLVLAATAGGQSDLYRIGLADGSLSRLTDTLHTELQPRYSPDGSQLVYITDRGDDTSLDKLAYGAMKLAVRDLRTGDERTIALPGATKHIDPSFARGGGELYFVADPDGVPNVYRLDLESEEARRLTNVATGVSGFTELAPAFAVAGPSDTAVFTVFSQREYRLRTMDLAPVNGTSVPNRRPGEGSESDDEGVPDAAPSRPAALLVAEAAEAGIVSAYLAEPSRGLPDEQDFRTTAYRPRLKLTSLGQIAAGLSANRFGTSFFATASLSFTDLLNVHSVGVHLEIAGSARDLGGQVSYFNRADRFGWGARAARTPLRIESIASGEETVTLTDGTTVAAQVTERVIDRTYVDQAHLLGEYPFSRNLRFEVFTGYSRISFLREIRTTAIRDGEFLFERTEITTPARPLHLGQAGLAFAGDYSFAGFTGPLKGTRFRADADASIGSFTLVSGRADFRHYAFIRPVGIALRLLHEGQYLRTNADIIAPLSLGAPLYVRGYSPASYTPVECGATTEGCPEYERIFGTRILAANAEVRLPFFGTEQLGLIPFRFLPTTLFAFVDAGVAWYRDQPPLWRWARSTDTRVPVVGVGGGARIGILGTFVLQVFYVYPFQRPERGGYVNLLLGAGF
jgi:hypothetical protein